MIYISWANSVNLDATSEGEIGVTTPVSIAGMRMGRQPRLVYCAAAAYFHDSGNWEYTFGYVHLDGSLECVAPNIGTVTTSKAATVITTELPNRILINGLGLQRQVVEHYNPGILLPVNFDIMVQVINQVNPAINDDYVITITLGIEEGDN